MSQTPESPAPDLSNSMPAQVASVGATSGAAQLSYQPILLRQPLTSRAKVGAFWAGAVGFNLLTLGFTLVVIPIFAALFGAFVVFAINLISRLAGELKPGFLDLREFLSSMDFGFLAIIGVAVMAIGLAIMAGALLASRAILRLHGVNRPGAVTWAGAGIAIVASWFGGWIPAIFVQALSTGFSNSNLNDFVSFSFVWGISWLVSVATTTIIGWLAWWWMAHVFRPDAGSAQLALVQETQG